MLTGRCAECQLRTLIEILAPFSLLGPLLAAIDQRQVTWVGQRRAPAGAMAPTAVATVEQCACGRVPPVSSVLLCQAMGGKGHDTVGTPDHEGVRRR
jgi:hypothetical protein